MQIEDPAKCIHICSGGRRDAV